MIIERKGESLSLDAKTHEQDVQPGRKNYLYLIWVMAVTDFKLKYDNSVLGYLWSLLKPLMMFGTLYLVFSVFVRWDAKHYNLYLLLGVILWNFLGEVTLNSMVMLEGKAEIIKKIYFPRWIIVMASSLTSLLTLALNMVVFLVFFVISGVPFSISLFMVALYLLELYVLVVGLSLILCALYPKFRDVHHIWEVFVQLGFWLTPIVYPISIVPEKYHTFIFLNPVARIIQGCRQAVIGSSCGFMRFGSHIFIALTAVGVFAIGFSMFNKLSRSFAEDL
ncbi:MAG: ABC transporter permease [Phycisphaerae bacterium]|nr:ABC transporter permease [Phycisphaerae bacterium]